MTVDRKYAQWVQALRCSHNGQCDVDALLSTQYGKQMSALSMLRFRFEEAPAGADCLNYYHALGIRKELFSDGDFFSRWAMFSPQELCPDKKYPLIFWNHGGGNPIETDEFSIHLTQMVANEQFMVCMMQTTNADNIAQMIPLISERYPVDAERIFVIGYSQGGQAAHAAGVLFPELFAGISACGCDAFPLWDNLDRRFTLAELDHLRDIFVPVMQIAGQFEFLNLLPHNRWEGIKLWPTPVSVNAYHPPEFNLTKDPTNPPGKRADKPSPPSHTNPDCWKLQKLNLRLISQGCKPVDTAKCLAFQKASTDELHRVLGFYGDQEEIRDYGGVKHYICDTYNADRLPAYRYIGVSNAPHWPPLMMAELSWEYLRQFRRDSGTGRIVADPYQK